MLVYRIALERYAHDLKASGRAARWNPNDTQVIYTSSSKSLACLENIVHRSQIGLNQLFNVMVITIGSGVKISEIKIDNLPGDWREFSNTQKTQDIGYRWLAESKYCILKVPSAIIEDEYNYLINPRHPDFKKIKLSSSQPFTFDSRFKL